MEFAQLLQEIRKPIRLLKKDRLAVLGQLLDLLLQTQKMNLMRKIQRRRMKMNLMNLRMNLRMSLLFFSLFLPC